MLGPVWLLPVLLLVAYLIVALPLGAARSASRRYANGGRHFGWASIVDGLLWLAVAAALGWGAYEFVPGVQSAMMQLCAASGGLLAMI